MYFKFIFFIFSTLFVFNSYASLALEKIPKNDAYPNQCYTENGTAILDIGKTYPDVPGSCQEKRCTDDADKDYYLLTYVGCSPFDVGPPCKTVEGDKSLPFPDCCSKVVC